MNKTRPFSQAGGRSKLSAIPNSKPIALALSGGGIRAMVFHLGVLRAIAEAGLLEQVSRLSTVSGGSLITGLIMSEAGVNWPSSSDFTGTIFPLLQEKLCSKSLQWGAVRELRRIANMRFILSRSNLLASALCNEWKIQSTLRDLPEHPEWSINGTTAETGRRFRFKRSSLGDYSLGYAETSEYPLANAMAVSAAFPGGFGPLQLQTSQFLWRKREWGETTEINAKPQWAKLHLYDGGVYDNLGLEPFFDSGQCKSKIGDEFIIASDAGAPLGTNFSRWSANPMRIKRVLDIISEQSRALRVRAFHHYLNRESERGSYIYIAQKDQRFSHSHQNFACNFPTTLGRISKSDFDRIENFSYMLALHKLTKPRP